MLMVKSLKLRVGLMMLSEEVSEILCDAPMPLLSYSWFDLHAARIVVSSVMKMIRFILFISPIVLNSPVKLQKYPEISNVLLVFFEKHEL